MKTMPGVLLAGVIALACNRSPGRADTAATRSDSGSTTGMAGMGGMMSAGMMDSMTVHLRSMDTASVASLQAMMPMYRQMAGNMIAQMNADMRSMNMPADARWSALMDSVRQDLVRMPDMNAQQMKAFMPAHHGRLTRLMQSHKAMMKM